MQVCGTRAPAADYSPDEGSHLEGLDYAQLDVSDAEAIENFNPPFDRLDVLVLAQGAVIYRRGEFEMAGFRKVLEVNLMSLMACAGKFHDDAERSQGLADHRQFDRRLSFDQRQPGLQCLEDRRDGADPDARARPGPRTASASTASRPAWSIPR